MTVLIPSPKIAARWHGALEARLRHAPLEAFLRARGQRWMLSGESRVTDNLACAAIFLIDAAMVSYSYEHSAALNPAQHSELGAMSCTVCYRLATAILEPPAWRIAALVSTARLLAPSIGLDLAARVAAAAARDYSKQLAAGSHEAGLALLATLVSNAVESNSSSLAADVSEYIRQRLSAMAEPSTMRRMAAAPSRV